MANTSKITKVANVGIYEYNIVKHANLKTYYFSLQNMILESITKLLNKTCIEHLYFEMILIYMPCTKSQIEFNRMYVYIYCIVITEVTKYFKNMLRQALGL